MVPLRKTYTVCSGLNVTIDNAGSIAVGKLFLREQQYIYKLS